MKESMFLKSAVLSLFTAVIAVNAIAQTSAEPLRQAVTPDKYSKLSVEQRQFYIAGILDANRVSSQQMPSIPAPCLNDLTLAQAADIVDRKLKTLEPHLRLAMPLAIHNAIVMNCADHGIQK